MRIQGIVSKNYCKKELEKGNIQLTSKFLDIIMVTIDSDISRKWTLLNIERALVSMNARIMLTSSSAAQYLQ